MRVLDGIDDIAVQRLTERDVVRHRLVQKIILAYEKYDRDKREKRDKYRIKRNDK